MLQASPNDNFSLLRFSHSIVIAIFLFAPNFSTFGQERSVGIGTDNPNPNAILDLESEDQGLLIPRITTQSRQNLKNAILSGNSAQSNGLLVYDAQEDKFYFWRNSDWITFSSQVAGNVELTSSKEGNEVTISGGGTSTTFSVEDPDSDVSNELQDLILEDNLLSLTKSTARIDLAQFFSDQAPQDLSSTRTEDDVTIEISGGEETTFSVQDADADPTNELISAIGLEGTTLSIDQAGEIKSVDLQSLQDDADADATNELITDAQLTGTNLEITDAGGTTTVDLVSLGSGTQSLQSVLTIDNSAANDKIVDLANPTNPQDAATKNYVDNISLDDADPDPTNEVQDLSLVGSNLSIEDGNTVDLSGIGTDDQTLSLISTALSIEDGNTIDLSGINTDAQILGFDGSILNISSGNSIDISSLQNDADADPANEIQDLADVIGEDNDAGAAQIKNLAEPTLAQDAATKFYVDNISVADADADPTNEIQDLAEVIGEDNDAGAAQITNLADPTLAQDAATKFYVDNISVADADADPTNEIQDLADVIGQDNDAGAAQITNLADPTLAQDAATKFYADNISVADADADPTNEIQDLADVIGQDNDAGAAQITNLADPTLAQDAATKFYVDNISVDDADADPANEIQDLADVIGQDNDAGAAQITNLADPTLAQDAATKFYVDNISVADADSDPTNELVTNLVLDGSEILLLTQPGGPVTVDLSGLTNTGFQVVAGDLRISDDGGNLTVPLSDLAVNTDFQVNGSNLETTDPAGTLLVPLADIQAGINVDDADADPTNEIQDLADVIGQDNDAGAAQITNLADPTLAQDAATKFYVDNISVADADADPTNEIQDLADVIGQDNDAGAAQITNLADPTLAQDAATKFYVDNISVADADADPINEIQDLADVIGEDNDAGAAQITNLANPTLAQDAATKFYVDNISVADADADPTNEIQDLADVIGQDNDAGAAQITNLADPTLAQDAATKFYVDNLSVDDADADPANEIQDLADVIGEDNDAGAAQITNLADPTLAQDAATKAYVDAQGGLPDQTGQSGNYLTTDGSTANWAPAGAAANPAAATAFKGEGIGAVQSMPALGAKIQFNENYDLGANFDDANDQYVIPSTGLYHFDALITFPNVFNNGTVTVEIQVDGSNVYRVDRTSPANATILAVVISIDMQLTLGQIVTLVGFGFPFDVSGNVAELQFSGRRIL